MLIFSLCVSFFPIVNDATSKWDIKAIADFHIELDKLLGLGSKNW